MPDNWWETEPLGADKYRQLSRILHKQNLAGGRQERLAKVRSFKGKRTLPTAPPDQNLELRQAGILRHGEAMPEETPPALSPTIRPEAGQMLSRAFHPLSLFPQPTPTPTPSPGYRWTQGPPQLPPPVSAIPRGAIAAPPDWAKPLGLPEQGRQAVRGALPEWLTRGVEEGLAKPIGLPGAQPGTQLTVGEAIAEVPWLAGMAGGVGAGGVGKGPKRPPVLANIGTKEGLAGRLAAYYKEPISKYRGMAKTDLTKLWDETIAKDREGLRKAISDAQAAPVKEPLAAAPALPAPAPAAKEPWMMTRAEYVDTKVKAGADVARRTWRPLTPKELTTEARIQGHFHEDAVSKALFEGKPVPSEVLSEYPELVAKFKPAISAAELEEMERTALEPEQLSALTKRLPRVEQERLMAEAAQPSAAPKVVLPETLGSTTEALVEPGALARPPVGELPLVPKVLYHGGPKEQIFDFDKLPLSSRADSAQLGYFFTPEPEAARFYAGRTGTVDTFQLESKNLYTMSQDEYRTYGGTLAFRKARERLLAEGYDAIYIPHMFEYVALKPEIIKRLPTVTPVTKIEITPTSVSPGAAPVIGIPKPTGGAGRPPGVPPGEAPPPSGPRGGAKPANVPQGVADTLAQAKAVVARDKPGAINRMVDFTPGLKQIQRTLHPSVGMPEHITASWFGQGAAQATVSNALRAELLPELRKVDAAFGKGATRGKLTKVAEFTGPADQKVPFSGMLYDVFQRPQFYNLSEAQKALITEIQTKQSALLNKFRDLYGLDIGEFQANPGAVFLGNVDKTKGAIEMAGSETAVLRGGAAKERFYTSGADRYLHDKAAYPHNPERWFQPETNVGQLMSVRGNETLASMAGQNVLKAGLGGKTKLDVLLETQPKLAAKMEALKARLGKLKGYERILKADTQKAVDDFLASPIEDIDLATLREALEVELVPGRYVAKAQAGRGLTDVQKEITGIRAQIAGLRPSWRIANTQPYVLVKEEFGLYRYFPASEAKIIRHLSKTSESATLRLLDNMRATAFGGDMSPASIQGLNALFLDPVRTGKTLATTGPRQLFSEAALAADVRASPDTWELFTRATGLNPLGGVKGSEFGTGFIAKIPKVGKAWERWNEGVYRPTMWAMKKSFDGLIEDGLKHGLTREQAAAVAGDDVTKLIPNYNYRRLGMSQAESAKYRAVLTSVSFLTQPAALMTDATKGILKLGGVVMPLTPSESYAVKRVLTLVALTETIAVTSNAYYAQSQGQDVEQAIKDSLNPASGYFMSVVLPNGSRVGIGGPFRSLIKAVYPREIPGVPFPLPFAGMYNFSLNKMAPGIRVAYDEVRNEDYFRKKIRTGEFPFNVLRGLEYAVERTAPLTVGTVGEQIRRGEPGEIPTQMASQFAGVNLVPEDKVYNLKLRWTNDGVFKPYEDAKAKIREAGEKTGETQSQKPVRDLLRENPELEAKLFLIGRLGALPARPKSGIYPKSWVIAVQLMRENGLQIEDIEGLKQEKVESKDRKALRAYFERALGAQPSVPMKPTPKPVLPQQRVPGREERLNRIRALKGTR